MQEMNDPIEIGMTLHMPIMERISKFAPDQKELLEIGRMIDCFVASAQVTAVTQGLDGQEQQYRDAVQEKLASLGLATAEAPKPVTPKKVDEKMWKQLISKIVEWAREHPGTSGPPDSLEAGGPGDSDCITAFLASALYAAGQRCRIVAVSSPAGDGATFVEVFHSGFPAAPKIMEMPAQVRGGFHHELPHFQWIPVLPFHGWIKEGREILTWKRIVEQEL
jgi:hypothetical protein